MTEGLELGILGPAFLAGLLVLATHVPLGQEVLKRGIIFIDLAVAQIAGLGIIAADAAGWTAQGWEVQLIAGGSAITGALLLNWLEQHFHTYLEAFIGVIFILAASTGVLLLAHNPHGGEHLRELMAGQILWVSNKQLLPVALVYMALLAAWFLPKKKPGSPGFYFIFAVAVTASVQLVGVYLVFSSLIIPALATRSFSKNRLIYGYLVGICGYAAGLIVSTFTDLPSGPIIVWSLVIFALIFSGAARVMKAHSWSRSLGSRQAPQPNREME